MRVNRIAYLLLIVSLGYGCKDRTPKLDAFHFTQMDPSTTHIDFNNELSESDSVNFYTNEYMYNGSGVGIGDFNNDGLPDIYMGGSMVSSKLYLNKGNWNFEDITEKAGVTTQQWSTGISVVDINQDGFDDIYVCASHSADPTKRTNQLFINDGHLHFTDQAAAYGLADTGFSTQAAFLDYDRDGDLDMYLLNHRLYNRNPNNLVPKDTSGRSPAQDCLYRNDGILPGAQHPRFTNVAMQAGIREDGYGLGIVVTDVNQDHWPDLYIANDYLGNDLLWLNNRNGTFSNVIKQTLQHQSFNSMGVDAADINNDGLPDVTVLDMSPENNERKKMMFNGSSQERYDMERSLGYEPEFVRNMLQLNNGLQPGNKNLPFYSEIGQLAGISETDWSWSVLVADFDNDGWKDMHITNGLARDLTNTDYVAFKNAQNKQDYTFNGGGNVSQPLDKKAIALLRDNLDQYGSIKVNNYFFHNNGALHFDNTTAAVGLATPSVSNGAAYADLDNDGDLDLVVNNMNQPCFVWKNELRSTVTDSVHNFLRFQLLGAAGNSKGFGAFLTIYNKGVAQVLEQSPVRGFSSSVDQRLLAGIGTARQIDSVKVVWPNGVQQVLTNIKANQTVILKATDAVENGSGTTIATSIFSDISGSRGLNFTHTESRYFDFGSQRALPQKYSQQGPALATGDVNGDGLMDVFVGGAAYQSGQIYLQQVDGSFKQKALVGGQKNSEDINAVFFDADGDHDLDLLIAGGSQEFGGNAIYNQPHFYSNDGKGNFTDKPSALPGGIADITQAIAVGDYDGDGDQDVFLAGRVVPQHYPQSPRSYLLQNNQGIFTDVTQQACAALLTPGMITGAVFTDINNDQQPDLILAGEWMPIRIFTNQHGTFTETTAASGLTQLSGQWRSLSAADLDGDGDMDLVAGNMGNNNKYHVTPQQPLQLYAGDFDGNRFNELIPAYYIKDNEGTYQLFPALDRNQLADQLPIIKKQYLLNSTYAKATMKDLLEFIKAPNLQVLTCETTTSVWLENKGKGQFSVHALPVEAQFAPINSIQIADLNQDGIKDLVIAGNEYQSEVVAGQYDASFGWLLQGVGKGQFKAVPPTASGLVINGDVKAMVTVLGKQQSLLVAAVNNAALKVFAISNKTVQ